jgi:hypothetical protein
MLNATFSDISADMFCYCDNELLRCINILTCHDISENIVGRGVKHYPSLLAIGCWKYLDSVVYWMLEVFGQCGILSCMFNMICAGRLVIHLIIKNIYNHNCVRASRKSTT